MFSALLAHCFALSKIWFQAVSLHWYFLLASANSTCVCIKDAAAEVDATGLAHLFQIVSNPTFLKCTFKQRNYFLLFLVYNPISKLVKTWVGGGRVMHLIGTST